MNVGILLTGISYTSPEMKIHNRRDFRKDYQNFFDTIFNPLTKEGFDVFTYVTTYSHEYNELLLKTYNPKKYQFLEYENSDQRLTHIKSLDLIEDENLDLIIITRFDIEFKQKIIELNYNVEKVNFLYGLDVPEAPWETHEFVTDNLIILPKKFLKNLKNSIMSLYTNPPRQGLTDLHGIYKTIKSEISEENTNLIIKELQNKSGVYYNLKRA